MLTFTFNLVRNLAPLILYLGGIFTCLLAIFGKPKWGFFLMVALIPQPNIFYNFYDFPMGQRFLDFLFIAVLVGIFVSKKNFTINNNSIIIGLYILISYISLWNSSMYFSLPAPITTQNALFIQWKSYAMMIFIYFLTLNTLKDEDQQKILVIIMAAVILFISIRSYRSFTAGASFAEDSRMEGPFWRVGLGSNHYGAFLAHYCSVFLGLLLFDKDKKRRLLFLATILFGIHSLFFTYSRGAYAGALGVLVFFGIMKKRSLLVLVLVIFLSWHTLLPPSVVDRIQMTKSESGELESSAAARFSLWDHAMTLFKENPVFGVGYGGYGLTVPKELRFTDTHNFYLKTLSEQGMIGLVLLLFICFRAFRSGQRLFKIGKTWFYKGLGFGFLGCTVACMITNMFGDRWSYFVLGDYFWVFWGLVDRAILNSDISVAGFDDKKPNNKTELQ